MDIVLVADVMFTVVGAVVPWVIILFLVAFNARHKRRLKAAIGGLRTVRNYDPEGLDQRETVGSYRMIVDAVLEVVEEG